MTAWCLPLESLSHTDLPTAGGKGANLGELIRGGFPVPRGFIVTTGAYRTATGGLSRPTRNAVAQATIPAEVADAIRAAYTGLGGGPVAVRSSATAEDLPGAAFAGQQDTYLNVVGADAVVGAVRDCWASLWTDRAIAYRARLGIPDSEVAIAVVVQEMVDADWAGVMFTADPVTGERDHVVIDSSPGLGESVVSGSVTPDHAVLDPRGSILERRPGRFESVVRPVTGGGTRTVTDLAGTTSLAEELLGRLADTGRRIATHFGSPQDIEWAVAGDRLHITQARPMTALPPAPRQLNRLRRTIGGVVVELLPRRPLPMERTAWVTPVVLAHVQRMLEAILGVRLDVAAAFPTRDGTVTEFVPPMPLPRVRTPARLLRSLVRSARHSPRDWESDPLTRQLRQEAATLDSLDVDAATWAQLLAVRESARHVTDLVADVRARYLPAAGRSLILLRLALRLRRRGRSLPELVAGADTQTLQANRGLLALADTVRATPQLRQAFETLSPPELVDVVARDEPAAQLRAELATFLARFGHRETTGLMMLRDPTWGAAPHVVLGLVQVMLTAPPADDHHTALAALPGWLDRLVAEVRAGAAFREDTHFELTRVMPVMRRTVMQLGERLAQTGAIEHADDVWFLEWDEVAALPDPNTPLDWRETIARRRASDAALAGAPLISPRTLHPQRPSRDGILLEGVPGGGGRRTAAVRIIRHPEEFPRLRSGEVLVCAATNPSWTPLFARAGALITDNGGPASHAAIVAREYRLPTVLATGTATATLVDGQRVTVDGDDGVVLPAPEST